MEITSLKCNHCAADLDVNQGIKFFNCSYCGSSLTIKESGGVVFTEVIGEIKANTEAILDNSNLQLLEHEVERIDREWLLEREPFMVQKNGQSVAPDSGSSAGITFGVITIMLLGIMFFFSIAGSNSPKGDVPIVPILFGLLFTIAVLIGTSMSNSNKYNSYTKAKKEYENRRNDLLAKMETLKAEEQSE